MIVLTVKTLDSQNHSFTVDDDMTVEQFKVHIADTVNIPAATQRIIYCGRVLQDSSKLIDYDVNGKVVHLVQRPPPCSSSSRPSQSPCPHPPRRVFRNDGNAMYVGSMAFPSNLMDSQGIASPPSHSLARSRLNVARRMLRRAEQVITSLENPRLRPNEQNSPEEPQDEVTPVIEARVVVPSSSSDPIDGAMVLSAVQSSLFSNVDGNIAVANVTESIAPNPIEIQDGAVGSSVFSSQSSTATSSPVDTQMENAPTDAPRPTEGIVESTSNVEANPNTGSAAAPAERARPRNIRAAISRNILRDNISRTSEMAELLTTLTRLQTRFEPFLEAYHTFMQEDPVVANEDLRTVNNMINRVSEVMHYLGHAYHSLSDIILRVRTAPPRPLLCRPIMIQHSAVLQAGIPIQVEINLSNDRPPPTTGASATSTTTTTAAAPPSTTGTGIPVSTTNSATTSNPMIGIPFLPMNTVRVQSFPIEIRGISIPASAGMSVQARPPNNNNVPSAVERPAVTESVATTQSPPTTTAPTSSASSARGFNFSNPNVEFFMEVTPEGISIDSLETTVIGSNQANDLLRGGLGSNQPDLIQSLMQMANQFMRGGPPSHPSSTTSASATTTAPAEATQSSASASTTASAETAQSTAPGSAAAPSAAASGQNSQARVSTQTFPTTSTSTRSTPSAFRPHVHLQQQSMQGGFDPFLPCNSHHLTRRRLHFPGHAGFQAPAGSSAAARQEQGTTTAINNVVNGIINIIRTAYQRRNPHTGASQASSAPTPSGGAGEGGSRPTTVPPPEGSSTTTPSFQSMNLSDLYRQPTIADLLQLFPDDSYVSGESIITDLVMLLSQNLTIRDVMSLNTGGLEPIDRMRSEIQEFFIRRILGGSTNAASIQLGVDRLIAEITPFIKSMRQLEVRDGINIEACLLALFRNKFPIIIRLASTLTSDSSDLASLVEHLRQTVDQLCAITLHASANGLPGAEQIFQTLVARYMQGIPNDLQDWTLRTSLTHFRQYVSTLNVPFQVIEPFIVRSEDMESATWGPSNTQTEPQPEDNGASYPMEVDEQVANEASVSQTDTSSTPPLVLKLEETDSLPNLVIGSEPWHAQVPNDWVPIITRDSQRQRRQGSQPPFSDAYLSGMPSKRRKLVHASRSPGTVPQTITEGVRRAVTAAGLTSAAPLETVAQEAGASENIQNAYRSLLRSTVQASLRDNESFTPDRFPNASNYFNDHQ